VRDAELNLLADSSSRAILASSARARPSRAIGALTVHAWHVPVVAVLRLSLPSVIFSRYSRQLIIAEHRRRILADHPHPLPDSEVIGCGKTFSIVYLWGNLNEAGARVLTNTFKPI